MVNKNLKNNEYCDGYNYNNYKDKVETGKDLYLEIVNVLTPNSNDYYVDFVCDMINEYLSIKTITGQNEIRELITKYFNNIKTATEFDVRTAYSEILTAINVHSTDEIVKITFERLWFCWQKCLSVTIIIMGEKIDV